MSDTQSFLDRVMAGTLSIGESDVIVESWHEGASAEPLHDHLVMTAEEYSLWLEHPDMLTRLCAARRAERPLVEAVNDAMPRLRRAERSGDAEKLKSLERWLQRRTISADGSA